MSRQMLNPPVQPPAGPSGAASGASTVSLGHSSSSSILSQSSLSSGFDDKAYTANALKAIRNSLQPFATKVNGNGAGGSGSSSLDRRPSSASSNASSSSSIPAHLYLGNPSGASGPAGGAPHTYAYGQVAKLSTGASSTQINLGHLNLHNQGQNPNQNGGPGAFCDTTTAASGDELVQKQLLRQILDMIGITEEAASMLSINDLSVILGNVLKQMPNGSSMVQADLPQRVAPSPTPPTTTSKSSSGQAVSQYPQPPLQYHQLPSHPIVIDRMSLHQPTATMPMAPLTKLLATPKLVVSPGTAPPLSDGHNQMDTRFSSEAHSNGAFSRERPSAQFQPLPSQPKILNSAGVSIVDDYRFQAATQHQQPPSSYPSSFHAKIVQMDSAGNSCYSSSSSSNGALQNGFFTANNQNSTSSLASSTSSTSSSPYRMILPSNGVSNGPACQLNTSGATTELLAAFQKRFHASKGGDGCSLSPAFRPTDPLPPPPLPPHRKVAETGALPPPPPPLPPHARSGETGPQSFSINGEPTSDPTTPVSATSALSAAVAGNPQFQQYIKQHMAMLASTQTASPLHRPASRGPAGGRPGALSYASSASSSSPPQRETSPLSFGRARLKAAALAAAGQHQNGRGSLLSSVSQCSPLPNGFESNGSSLSASGGSAPNAGQLDKLLAAQVTAKLQSLTLGHLAAYHAAASPPPSYAASSSSGLQSPTPTFSSSSDYATVPGPFPPTSSSSRGSAVNSAFPYASLANLHQKLSSIASAANFANGSSPRTAQLAFSTESYSDSPTPSDAQQMTNGSAAAAALTAWSSRHAVSQSPIIMQSVKSQKVQKPILQTAVAPLLPPLTSPSANSTLKAPLLGVHREFATIPSGPVHSASGSLLSSASSTLKGPLSQALLYNGHLGSPVSSSASSLRSVSLSQVGGGNGNGSVVRDPPPYNGFHSRPVVGEGSTHSPASSTTSSSHAPLAPPPPPYPSAVRQANSSTSSLFSVTSSSANYHNLEAGGGASDAQSPPPPPPPPYAMSLSMLQHDSLSAISNNAGGEMVNYTLVPPPSAYGGSNSSVTSSSTANANGTFQATMQVPTTEPPSYASSMAALAAQRAVVSGTTSVFSSGPLNMAATAGTVSVTATPAIASLCSSMVPPSIAKRPLPPPPPSEPKCDLVSTVESICSSQVSLLSARLPPGQAAANRAFTALSDSLDETVPEVCPPLPPKPSANGGHSSMGPPPPLPPQPPHIQAAQQKLANEAIAASNESITEFTNSCADSPFRRTLPSLLAATILEESETEDSPPGEIETIDSEDGCRDVIERDFNGNISKHAHTSPIPQRRSNGPSTVRDFKPKNYSPAAYKFFMEQHMENLLKLQQERSVRQEKLEKEITKVELNGVDALAMRRMLHQKESNYIRLRRARMDRSMFKKIRTIGVGAFGEVALVKKRDGNTLYAMKTLRKVDVLKRNQVAHVKAERDILAEADNEWVVKLYFSFQDAEQLYFVMDYIPGGDLMSLLIKFNLFNEPLARFYIAELVLAVESVHKMGFIHRDIKPDNVLIDHDGHIKLTDFGLCTGFRWTHDSKYYHERGNSMAFDQDSWPSSNCNCSHPKETVSGNPLERRKHRREHHRCLAHSLVGTPNYIAPEVLQRRRGGYTQGCDWWSVGVILYEAVIGSPPFFASTPEETQHRVTHWQNTLCIPQKALLAPETEDLIRQLCRGPESRIGREGGAEEIKGHPFFAVDWRQASHSGTASLAEWNANPQTALWSAPIQFEVPFRGQVAPYQPPIKHAMDTSNFDPIPGRVNSDDSELTDDSEMSDFPYEANGGPEGGRRPRRGNKGPESDPSHPQHAFFEFTFRRFFDSQGRDMTLGRRIALEDEANGNTSAGGRASSASETENGSVASASQSVGEALCDIYDEVYSETSSLSASINLPTPTPVPAPVPEPIPKKDPFPLNNQSASSTNLTTVAPTQSKIKSIIHELDKSASASTADSNGNEGHVFV